MSSFIAIFLSDFEALEQRSVGDCDWWLGHAGRSQQLLLRPDRAARHRPRVVQPQLEWIQTKVKENESSCRRELT